MADRLSKRDRALNQLSGWRATAFMLGLAQRAWPNLELVNQLESFEWPAQTLIDDAWTALQERSDEADLVVILDELLAWYAELDGLDTYGSVQAKGTIDLLELALLSMLNTEERRAKQAFDLSFAQVTGHVEITEGEGLNDEELVKLFDAHALIKRHLGFIQAFLSLVQGAKSPSAECIRSMKRLANENVSHIGISAQPE